MFLQPNPGRISCHLAWLAPLTRSLCLGMFIFGYVYPGACVGGTFGVLAKAVVHRLKRLGGYQCDHAQRVPDVREPIMEDHNRSNYRQPASPGTEPSPGQAQAGSSGNSGPDTSVDAGTSDTSRRVSDDGAERRPRGWRQRVGRTMSMPVGPEQQAVPSAPFFSCTVQYQGRGQLRRCFRVYTPARSPSPYVGQLFLVEFAPRPQRRQASGSYPYPSS